ncbi:hypothetical protein B0W81_01515 [Prochlorococcus sp. HOT_208_60]|nr:hypothetical protein B0W81_01515 [Prochlorococcus sp. HOT_208_60]
MKRSEDFKQEIFKLTSGYSNCHPNFRSSYFLNKKRLFEQDSIPYERRVLQVNKVVSKVNNKPDFWLNAAMFSSLKREMKNFESEKILKFLKSNL